MFLVNSHSNDLHKDTEEDNNNETNNDQSDNKERSEEQQESDKYDNDNDNDNDNENDESDENDENDGESQQIDSSAELYKKFNFTKCIKNDKSFFNKSGEYTCDSENGMTRFKPTDSSEVYYKYPILDRTSIRRLRFLLPKQHLVLKMYIMFIVVIVCITIDMINQHHKNVMQHIQVIK